MLLQLSWPYTYVKPARSHFVSSLRLVLRIEVLARIFRLIFCRWFPVFSQTSSRRLLCPPPSPKKDCSNDHQYHHNCYANTNTRTSSLAEAPSTTSIAWRSMCLGSFRCNFRSWVSRWRDQSLCGSETCLHWLEAIKLLVKAYSRGHRVRVLRRTTR